MRGHHRRFPALFATASVALTLLLGCRGSEGGTDASDPGDNPPKSSPAEAARRAREAMSAEDRDAVLDRIYRLEEIPTFDLELDATARKSLARAPKEYVRGGFRWGEHDFGPVGIRLKGSTTLTGLDEKPPLKIRVDAFRKGQDFFGQRTIILNNFHEDASMLREHVSYAVFRALGHPASRSGYARVRIDGADYGLYLCLEPIDPSMLARWFGDPSGNLYEGEEGADIDTWPTRLELKAGQDSAHTALTALHAHTQGDAASFFYGERARDTRAALSFLTVDDLLKNPDGYGSAAHNYFLYHEPRRDGWSFLPWSMDRTLGRMAAPLRVKGFVKARCFTDDRCAADYVALALTHTARFERMAVADMARNTVAAIEPYAVDDPRKRHSNARMRQRQGRIVSWSEKRPREFSSDLEDVLDGQRERLPGRLHHAAVGLLGCWRPDKVASCEGYARATAMLTRLVERESSPAGE